MGPYTRPVLAEVEGEVGFEDPVDGASVSETTDETTGFTKRVVSDRRTSQRSDQLKPAIVIKRGDSVVKLDRGGEARYLLSVDAVIAMEPGEKVAPGDVLARIPLESAKTKDITGGLPRVAELFEARRPKDHAIIAEISGTVRFGRDYKNKRRVIIEANEEGVEPVEYLIPKGGRSICRKVIPSRRVSISSMATRPRTTSSPSRASRNWRATWSTKSRKSIACRAC